MNRNVIVVFILTAALWTAAANAGTPTFGSYGLKDGTIREMDLLLLSVQATDTHPLDYVWSITLDESGKAFFQSASHTSAEFGVRWISASAAGQLNGKKVVIQVLARHANPLVDGSEEAVTSATLTIEGVNHPPVPVITGKLGTPTDRIPTLHGVCAEGYESSDPDGDTVRGNWAWGGKTGGRWQTTLGDVPPTLIGSEGGRCCFSVLGMTAPIDQQIELTLQNGLHTVKTVATCYLKPADAPVQTNSAPTITFPVNPVQATVGSQAQLVADVEDLDGDACTYSLVYLQDSSTVATSAVSVTTTRKRVTATVSKSTAGTYQYRLTARETNTTDHKTTSANISLVVGSGGGGNPGNGGPGDVTDTPDTCDPTETGGPPSITITPNPTTTKPLFKSGDSVRIAVVSSDSSQKTWMAKTVRGVGSITWGVSELTSLGINPTVSPTVARAADLFTSDSEVTFTVPTLTSARDVYLTVVSKDVFDCGRTVRFAIRLEPQATSNNQAPVAKIQYKIGSVLTYTNAPTTPVTVETNSAVTVTLKGDTSTDDAGASNLTYTWTKQDTITAGGVTLGSASGATTTLTVNAHTKGTLTVTLTAKDLENATGTAQLIFNIVDPAQKPNARATAKVGGKALSGPVEEGTVLTLDGSASSRPDNTKTGLTYQWTQTEGANVSITNADKSVATLTAPAGSEGATRLKFKLIVTDVTTPSDPVELTVELSPPSFYFSQVAVGSLGASKFRTVLLLVNRNETSANGVQVNFFGQDGGPMEVTINDVPWASEPFDIPPLGAKRLVFAGQELKSGWAKVKANIKIVGLVQYQIVGANENLESEVGLYATEAATKFATFYDLAAETAIAVANPGSQPATVTIRLMDDKTGKEVVSKNLFVKEPGQVLPGMHHNAKFLTLQFLGELPLDFSLGTLLIESDVPVCITVLKTRGGVVFSTLPVASMK